MNRQRSSVKTRVAAVVVAAGLSRRMGRFKLTLPWGETTVIGQVVSTLEAASLAEIVVVTGHRADDVTTALADTSARTTHNAAYTTGEMLGSIQAGLQVFGDEIQAVLLCLGDQPQMRAETVQEILARGEASSWQRIVVPSFRMRAGHPILLPRWLWPEILAEQGTLRDVLTKHLRWRTYVNVDTPTILADLDTPADYANSGQIQGQSA